MGVTVVARDALLDSGNDDGERAAADRKGGLIVVARC